MYIIYLYIVSHVYVHAAYELYYMHASYIASIVHQDRPLGPFDLLPGCWEPAFCPVARGSSWAHQRDVNAFGDMLVRPCWFLKKLHEKHRCLLHCFTVRPLGLSQIRNSTTLRLPWCYVKHLCKVGNVSIAPFCCLVSASDWPLLWGEGRDKTVERSCCVQPSDSSSQSYRLPARCRTDEPGPQSYWTPNMQGHGKNGSGHSLAAPPWGPTFRLWVKVRPPTEVLQFDV